MWWYSPQPSHVLCLKYFFYYGKFRINNYENYMYIGKQPNTQEFPNSSGNLRKQLPPFIFTKCITWFSAKCTNCHLWKISYLSCNGYTIHTYREIYKKILFLAFKDLLIYNRISCVTNWASFCYVLCSY